jgi:hypothetical protein
MFPQLRQRIGPALDLIVEFSTLGEYRLDADGVLCPASAFAHVSERAPQLGGAGDSVAGRAAVRRIVAGGAAGLAPAATPAALPPPPFPAAPPPPPPPPPTPAARRLGRDVRASEAAQALACSGERRHTVAEHPAPRRKPRPRVVAGGEQLCLAV